MRTRPALSGASLPKLAVILLGCVMLACGCGEDGGGSGAGAFDPSASASRTADPEPEAGDPTPDPVDPPPDPVEATAKVINNSEVGPPGGSGESGPHVGEHFRLEVDIVFSREFGETVTDETGTYYHVGDMVSYEDKVYPSEYWGTFPLYFFGTEVGVTVTIRNLGPRQRARLRIRTEAFVLRTDGTNGGVLAPPRDIMVDVLRGQSVTIDASFTSYWSPDLDSGLDRFIVSILHPNEGGGGSDESALIMTKEGIFCPPEERLIPSD